MAIKKGNVRLQVTVSEDALRDLDELCELTRMSRSRVVAQAIGDALIDARVEAVEKRKEEREAQGQ